MEQEYFPYKVFCELTNACNLNCKHCLTESSKPLPDELSTNELYSVFQQLADYGTEYVELTGGEPLLRKDFDKILDLLNRLDFQISICSNGILITEKMCCQFKEYGVEKLQLSIDGLENTHDFIRNKKGAFQAVIKSISLLKMQDLDVNVRSTAMRDNLDELTSLANLISKLDVDGFGAVRLFPVGRAKIECPEQALNARDMLKFHQIMQEIEKDYSHVMKITYDHCGFFDRPIFDWYREHNQTICQCGRKICVIKPNGTVTPCEIFALPAGNLRRQSFVQIWENSESFAMFRNFDPNQLKGTCRNCSEKYICGGYCRALAMTYFNDFCAEDPTCWRVQINKK
nr:conserved hypothetical protein radical SAM superfamily [uncultured archaeon]